MSEPAVEDAVVRLSADSIFYNEPFRLAGNEVPRDPREMLTDLRTLLAAYAADREEIERLSGLCDEQGLFLAEDAQAFKDLDLTIESLNSKLGLAVKALEAAEPFIAIDEWMSEAERDACANARLLARSTLVLIGKEDFSAAQDLHQASGDVTSPLPETIRWLPIGSVFERLPTYDKAPFCCLVVSDGVAGEAECHRDEDGEPEWWWANTHGDYHAEEIFPTLWQPLPPAPSSPDGADGKSLGMSQSSSSETPSEGAKP